MRPLESIVFAALFVFSLLFFLRRVYILFALVLLGRGENRFDHLRSRFTGMLFYGFLQRRVIEEPFGINHFFLFWGFVILFLVNVEFVMTGLFPRFSLGFIGFFPYCALRFVADIMSFLVLCAVVIAIVRRLFFRPPHVEATVDAFVILTTVALLMVAYFGLSVTGFGLGLASCDYMPVSLLLAGALVKTPDPHVLYPLSRLFWWAHAFFFLFFLDYIPYSKHLHIITSLPNCFFRSFRFVSTLPRMVFKKGMSFGVSKVIQFAWKDLLDFLSCTECGRCEAACPAHNTGKVLNPKRVVLNGRKNLFVNGRTVLASRPFDTLGRAHEGLEMDRPLIGEGPAGVSTDAVWACTTCGACTEKCPVFIEQFPKLLWMRRHLVMEKAFFPEELVPFFENIEQRSNPWGIAPSERGKWAQGLDVEIFSPEKEHEFLLYLGCVGSFDSRTKNVATALVRVLRSAGLTFGIFGAEERCCGDAMRRLGNEYIFDKMARDYVKMFQTRGVRKIITLCPHCYNTLKNDYRDYGADFEVFHHAEVIDSLLKRGTVELTQALKGERIVIHDSCYLGRYNGIYEAPRSIVEAATNTKPLEMEKRRRESFCCGAGGGRMWMEEKSGTRINRERTKQALKAGPTVVATCCPYCLTMFEDGIKDEGAQMKVRVMDIAEIIKAVMNYEC